MAITPLVTPYMTSNDLINAVKRKISFPTSQVTFSDDDILAFANEEMFIGQVPSVLIYHEEFFVISEDIPLINNKTRYPIPNRAIGMKLRDLFWKDQNGNLYELSRIGPEDKAYFQRDFNTGRMPYPYYIEGNEVVLASGNFPNPTGYLTFSFFIRPNQLVTNDNAATITSFSSMLTIDNASLVVGDQLQFLFSQANPLFNIPGNPVNPDCAPWQGGPPYPYSGIDVFSQAVQIFTATTGTPLANQFLIGIDSATTATNLVAAINTNGFTTATNTGAVITITFTTPTLTPAAKNILGYVINPAKIVNFSSIPTNITNTSVIDFLQTNPGHRILEYDVTIPPNTISGNSIFFTYWDVPLTAVVGDYICLANTAIIPYIPPDLHNVLAERTCARILSSIGDLENLGTVQAKIKEMELNQGMLLDNRIEGRPRKVMNRHSLLHYGKKLVIRRF